MKTRILIPLIISIPFFTLGENVNQEWVKKFSNKNARGDLKVQTDSEGYLYVAGTFVMDGNGSDWQLIKLSPNSDTIFKLNFNGEYNGDDFVNAIAIDNADNVYLTGLFTTGGNESSVAALNLAEKVIFIWQNISTSSSGINEGLFIVTDSAENVFIDGNLDTGRNSDVFVKSLIRWVM